MADTENKNISTPSKPKAPNEASVRTSIEPSSPTDVPQRQAVPEIIREAQGDLADRAEIEIEQEIQEQIMNIRKRIPRPQSPQPS